MRNGVGLVMQIKGEKVTLRDVTEKDVENIYYWKYQAADREHLHWNAPYNPPKPMSLEEFRNVDKTARNVGLTGTDEVRSELVIDAEGVLIGTVGWYWVDEQTNWLCNGIVIFDSDYWSGGYGTEAFQLWTNYIFEHMDVARVGISTWSGNERMMRLARKTGMIEEGRIRKARIVNGAYYDSVKMGVLREEWERMDRNGAR